MKINVDIRSAAKPISGISTFKIETISHLLQNYSDIAVRGCFCFNRNEKKADFTWLDEKEVDMSLIPDKIIFNDKYHIPINYERLFGNDVSLNLFLTFFVPYVNFKKPLISTIHDLIVLKTNVESKDFVASHKRRIEYAIGRSNHILTVSESSKIDLCNYFHVDPSDISIVHNGLNVNNLILEGCNQNEIMKLRIKYKLPEEDFILYFGGYRKHKNIESLLKAYSLLSDVEKKNLKVVITNKNQDLIQLANELHIDKNVFFTGFIDDSDKFILYKTAKMVYYASLCEGWGVPILESQICKTPVITSNISSMPEASGGYAMLVNPYSVDEIVDAIRQLDKGFVLLDELLDKGYMNARKYTWDKSADELYNVLRKYS